MNHPLRMRGWLITGGLLISASTLGDAPPWNDCFFHVFCKQPQRKRLALGGWFSLKIRDYQPPQVSITIITIIIQILCSTLGLGPGGY